MTKYLFILLFASSLTTNAQYTNKQIDSLHELAKKTDSAEIKINAMQSRTQQFYDSISTARNIENMTGLMKDIERRNEKARQGAYWRIGFGVAMLIVLIIGLLRKKKKLTN